MSNHILLTLGTDIDVPSFDSDESYLEKFAQTVEAARDTVARDNMITCNTHVESGGSVLMEISHHSDNGPNAIIEPLSGKFRVHTKSHSADGTSTYETNRIDDALYEVLALFDRT